VCGFILKWSVVWGRAVEDEATLIGVGGERDVGFGWCVGWSVEMQDKRMRVGGREDEWSAFDRKNDGGLKEASDVVGVGGAQRRRDGGLDGGKADDEN